MGNKNEIDEYNKNNPIKLMCDNGYKLKYAENEMIGNEMVETYVFKAPNNHTEFKLMIIDISE